MCAIFKYKNSVYFIEKSFFMWEQVRPLGYQKIDDGRFQLNLRI